MAEEKAKTTLDKIEKLIVDGQKEVLERIDRVEERIGGVEGRIGDVETSLRQELGDKIDKLDKKVDKLDKKVDLHAQATHDLITDVRKDIKGVEDKLDVHMRQPAHA